MGLFVFRSWSAFRDFKSLTQLDQTKLILAAVQTVLVMCGQVKEAYKAVIEHYFNEIPPIEC